MIGVFKALYDYTPQDPENELALVEDQILYILDQDDAECVPCSFSAFGLQPRALLPSVPPTLARPRLLPYPARSVCLEKTRR